MTTRYKAVLAADMDYTLLLPGQDVPPENERAVKRLQDNGIAFTIATGRSSFLVGKFAERLGIDIPIITGNGGALFDPVNRKDIVSSDFSDSKVRNLLKLMVENKVNATLYSVTGIYFTKYSKRKFFCEDYNKDVEPAKQAPLFDLDDDCWKRDDLPPFNKFLLIDPPEEIIRSIENDPDLTVISSGPTFYDIMTANVTKGQALLGLADYLNIPRGCTFAIGDSDNDISMIADAKYGIAMGNACDGAKKAAAYITAAVSEMGFAKAVDEFVIPTASRFT
ncbi:MAG: HAD family phosphatase [Ruminococcaceae bacterium]|nr:HAD family phosphatase [Oscillospiraceae bacterium]